jgi:EAL domain-containing protein (putative c-di-GMP-specific phosphodiesterase class I)
MRSMMQSCQALGVRFALDDFGTGFSSLSYLKRLPAETIKIDQSFIRGIVDDHDDLTLVNAIIALAAAFQRKVIAEGVETQAHSDILLQLGCELAQGYVIARPMPGEQVPEWARSHHHASDPKAVF